MQEFLPSRTAIRVALRRAAHQLYDSPIVFHDPIAVPLLGETYAEELRRTEHKLEKPYSTAMRAFLIARSRFAEDHLAQAVANGVKQYVLLGAGLDTFAYRNPYPELRVFEIDHPATQQWKRELLQRGNITIPGNLTYAPVDFERQLLSEELQNAGFDSTAPTFFSWLGVIPYLTLAAFRATVSFLAERPTGSGLVFDYGQPREVLPPLEQLSRDSLASRVQLAGEPFQLFFTPETAAAELSAFSRIEDIGVTEINARYFANRADQLQMRGSAGRILCAWR
jgi:methyltransferase (TIGR00027 family)